MAVNGLPAVNINSGKWSYVAFQGPANWFNQGGGTTEATAILGSNVNWDVKKKVTVVNNTTLVIEVKSNGAKLKPALTDGTITVTLSNANPASASTSVQYTDDPNPIL
jgi:hypothetical protein